MAWIHLDGMSLTLGSNFTRCLNREMVSKFFYDFAVQWSEVETLLVSNTAYVEWSRTMCDWSCSQPYLTAFLAPANRRKAPLLNYSRENKARHDRSHACKFGFDWNHLNLKMSNHITCIWSWLYFFSNAAYPLLNLQRESWKKVQILTT